MRWYPQLISGAVSQFPVRRRIKKRTVRNVLGDGRVWKLLDADGEFVEWELEYRGLTAGEAGELEDLFHQVAGRLGSFGFLDPLANLFLWSEELQQGCWVRDPFLALEREQEDPYGTVRGAKLRNEGVVPQGLWQALTVPAWYQYCFSLWARAAAGGELTLFARGDGSARAVTLAVGPSWRRRGWTVSVGSGEERIRFGVELAAGVEVEVFGLQVEAQPWASKYKKSQGRGGIYPEARFADDVLAVVAEGPDSYGCRVRVTAVP